MHEPQAISSIVMIKKKIGAGKTDGPDCPNLRVVPNAAASINTGRIQGGAPPFQPGQSGNPRGRPKGSRNKLSEDFITALQEDFAAYGAAVIQAVRENKPHEYLKIIASILPKELNIKTNPLEELSDDQLEEVLATVLKMIATGHDDAFDDNTKH